MVNLNTTTDRKWNVMHALNTLAVVIAPSCSEKKIFCKYFVFLLW